MIDTFILGKTFEGRDMLALRIHSPGIYNSSKDGFWFESNIHAREWISPATTLFILNELLQNYNQTKDIFDKFNLHYLPVLNVDGYIYTHTTNRLWRKNRRGGYGVDLNRNWKSGFGGPGSSGVRSSETYRGEFALSEPEVKNIADYLDKNPKIKSGIDFHSYSQFILRPWAKNNSLIPEEIRYRNIGEKMKNEIKKVDNQDYRNMRAFEMYVASGYATDHWYEFNKMIAFLIELRPKSQLEGGFILPPRFIIPTGRESFSALLSLLRDLI